MLVFLLACCYFFLYFCQTLHNFCSTSAWFVNTLVCCVDFDTHWHVLCLILLIVCLSFWYFYTYLVDLWMCMNRVCLLVCRHHSNQLSHLSDCTTLESLKEMQSLTVVCIGKVHQFIYDISEVAEWVTVSSLSAAEPMWGFELQYSRGMSGRASGHAPSCQTSQ